MPLSDYSDQQLLEELLRRAAKRDGLGLEGHQNGNLTQVSYREVVPVDGMPVPGGCEYIAGWTTAPQWDEEILAKFRTIDVLRHNAGTWKWRVPVKADE